MHTRYQDTTSKVDASAALFPIAITRRIQPTPAAYFLFASGLALLCIRRTLLTGIGIQFVVCRGFTGIFIHAQSMPECAAIYRRQKTASAVARMTICTD